MPGFDRTGPEGKGSKTGRGLGKCNPGNSRLEEQVGTENYPSRLGRRIRNGLKRGIGLGKGKAFGKGNF